MRKTVSLEFRNLIKRTYPGLDKSESYWRFMQYLLFTPNKDKNTGLPVTDQYHVARAENKLHILKNKHYCALDFLKNFQNDVMDKDTFNWFGWNHITGEARIAYVLQLFDLLKIFPKNPQVSTSS